LEHAHGAMAHADTLWSGTRPARTQVGGSVRCMYFSPTPAS
jgi:hypothetical protein